MYVIVTESKIIAWDKLTLLLITVNDQLTTLDRYI